LRRLYKEPDLRAQLRQAALQRVADFDMQKTIATLKDTYLAIMRGGLNAIFPLRG
jgi:hypothetical protein